LMSQYINNSTLDTSRKQKYSIFHPQNTVLGNKLVGNVTSSSNHNFIDGVTRDNYNGTLISTKKNIDLTKLNEIYKNQQYNYGDWYSSDELWHAAHCTSDFISRGSGKSKPCTEPADGFGSGLLQLDDPDGKYNTILVEYSPPAYLNKELIYLGYSTMSDEAKKQNLQIPKLKLDDNGEIVLPLEWETDVAGKVKLLKPYNESTHLLQPRNAGSEANYVKYLDNLGPGWQIDLSNKPTHFFDNKQGFRKESLALGGARKTRNKYHRRRSKRSKRKLTRKRRSKNYIRN
jgi:hypothetical protein